MKKLLLSAAVFAAFFATFVASATSAHAGEAKVNWGKLDEFTDIYPSYESTDRFREQLVKEFELMFTGLAKKLPDAYQLEVNISDIDLAGDVHIGPMRAGNRIRIMKSIYWPSINFTYEIKDDKGVVVVSGKEELRDMDYLSHIRIPSFNTIFEFEERMLQVWFKREILSGRFPSKDVKAVATNP